MRDINKIIVHCSDSPDTRDIGLAEINQWHKEREFTPYVADNDFKIYCGYHFVIRRSGAVEIGRPITEKGIHCAGQNSTSVGICMVGERNFSEKQMDSLMNIVIALSNRYGLYEKDIFGHNQFNKAKTCPNMDMNKFREEFKKLTGGVKNDVP